jgi:hypothetical protein
MKVPTHNQTRSCFPKRFAKSWKHCRTVLLYDATEFAFQEAAERVVGGVTYSVYKSGNTIKVCIGCAPTGYVSGRCIVSYWPLYCIILYCTDVILYWYCIVLRCIVLCRTLLLVFHLEGSV